MAQTWEAVDNVEPISDSTIEQLGNQALYNVVSGCALTYDAADMTVDLAAGVITHDGAVTPVAGGTAEWTLVSDPSNPRWTWLGIDDTGSGVIVSGDPAAIPSVPELGDNVGVALVYVQAGLTVASDATYKIDKRVPGGALTQVSRSTSNFTKNNNDTLGDVTGIAFPIGANQVWAFQVNAPASIGASPDIKLAFTVPAGASASGLAYVITDGATNTGTAGAVRIADLTASTGLAGLTAGVGLVISGVVVNSSTAGTVQLQAAQNSATAEDTIIYAQSFITAWRIA